MALTPCRECGHQVSEQAENCPGCGVVNPSAAAHHRQLDAERKVRQDKEKAEAATRNGCLGCLGVVLVFAIWIGVASSGSDPTPTSARTRTAPTPTALQLEARLNDIGAGEAILRVSADGTLAYVTVADAWYALPCFQRQRVAKGIRTHWRAIGGTSLIVQDIASTKVADFRITSDDFKITGCD